MQTSVLSRCIWRPANFIAQLPLILFSTISSTISIMSPQFQRPITNLWGSFTQRESHRNMSNYSQQWNYRQFFFRSSLKLLGSECIQRMKLVLPRLSWLWLWWWWYRWLLPRQWWWWWCWKVCSWTPLPGNAKSLDHDCFVNIMMQSH